MRFRFCIRLERFIRTNHTSSETETYDSLHGIILSIDALNAQDVVAKVERFELPLLIQ